LRTNGVTVDGCVVIAGAGLGGLRAAEQLRAAGHRGPVTVIGAEPHLPYNRPPLSKELLAAPGELTAQQAHEKVAFRRRAAIADVTFRLGVPVAAADLAAGALRLADGEEMAFDGLVVATGLRPRRLLARGAGTGTLLLPGAHVLRTLEDCLSLRDRLQPGKRVAIVGGGFIGCEVAGTALSRGCQVTVIEADRAPMLRVLHAELATAIQRFHEAAGISFVTGQPVTGVTRVTETTGVIEATKVTKEFRVVKEPTIAKETQMTEATKAARVAIAMDVTKAIGATGDGNVQGVLLGNGRTVPADVIIEATGSLACVEWLEGNGLDLSDGVLCDNTLVAAGAQRVVAVGDVARFPNPLVDGAPRRVEHWSMPADTARQAAATLTALLAGSAVNPAPFTPVPAFWSDQLDLRLQSYGAPDLADEVRITEGDLGRLTGGLVAAYHRDGRHVGTVAVNIAPARYRELREGLLRQAS
jgi:NADPH-dependent 2,4-dienoyl-CoA reductase/sulfur reductase-like enzyme